MHRMSAPHHRGVQATPIAPVCSFCVLPPSIRPRRVPHGRMALSPIASSFTAPVTVSDASVPEGHKGLHSSLYGEGGAERHAASEYTMRKGEDDGSTLLPVDEYLGSRDGDKPLGVYALYNSKREAQYVGYSRNMVLSIKAHLKRVGPERCAFARPMVFANRSMATRQNMEREVQHWIEELEVAPPGNGPERELWEGSLDPSVMSEAEKAEYDEKRLKLKKAMGESLGGANGDGAQEGETESDAERRRKIMAAVQNDDWSAVIDGQSREAVGAGPGHEAASVSSSSNGSSSSGNGKAASNAAAPAGQIVSPFTKATVHRSIGESIDLGDSPPKMTVESVNRALDQVRPYLIADGGNVEVADVAGGVVFLRLEGACNTCASSATTMRMGIERSLQAAFGEQLKEVIQVNAGETQVVSVTSVDAHLDKLRDAITGAGGKVQVVDVQKGTCVIKYSGPPALGKGISAAIRDTFARDIKEVVIVGF